jgi:hypothetical protein
VVFNDLGLAYVQMHDRARAVIAFRDALSRDIDYRPVRGNIGRLRDFIADNPEPLTHELEPNNTIPFANVIAMAKQVEGEIAQGGSDLDTFRVTMPPAPRDRVQIEITPAGTLAPRLRIYDNDAAVTPWHEDVQVPGMPLHLTFDPQPNTTLYLQVFGDHSTFGKYILSVKQLKQFDSYEPNDDIFTASKIPIGETVSASILDSIDTDFYSFVSPRNGTVKIDVEASVTLVPALTTFHPDRSINDFGPDIRTLGGVLHHTLAVQAGQTYYIQVWPLARTFGEYRLHIE